MRTEIITLPKLHKAQREIKLKSKRFNVLNCGRRWGKSILSGNLLIETAFTGMPSGYFTPTYKLLEGTYREVLSIVEPIVTRKHNNQFIELHGGGLIEFWTLDNPFAGRSRKYKRAVIDEASFAKSLWDSWNNAIRPTLTDLIGDAWFMSTPRGKNDFFKLYMRGVSGEKDWASWQMPTYSNPFIDKNEIEDAKRDLPEIAFNQEYLALFSDNAANPFGLDYIREVVKPLSKELPVCYGVDLAKSHDWTVIVGLDRNGNISFFDRWQSDWGQTKQRLKVIIGQRPALIDSTGVGDPVVEDIRRECHGVEGFHFTSTSKQQIMEGLANGIQNKKVSILAGIMQEEIESFEYEYLRTSVKYSAPTGLHDDCVCALALAHHKRTMRPTGMRVI